MPDPSFDTIRRRAIDQLTRLTNPQLRTAEHYPSLDNNGHDGNPDDIAEIHAMYFEGRWHVDVLFTNGNSYDYAADDARARQRANA